MTIRVGIGGWNYEPWHQTFYPAGMRKAEELRYASRAVTAIEVNATFYRTQSPATFAKWASEAPDNFVFALKAHRVTTHRRDLAEAAEAVTHFVDSGLVELGAKLGPLVWQFAPTKQFAADFEAFLGALPEQRGGLTLRHVVEVRNASFATEAFVTLARRYGVAICFADSPKFPIVADRTAPFTYARLLNAQSEVETGYEPAALDRWAAVATAWAAGETVADWPLLAAPSRQAPGDTFVFFINGAKERAPAAAMGLIERLKA